ncbi:MAG: ABC transporter permease, partial [Alphaproteobacteria bacterium]|nr:ABC transporter permease [Alphaproteobacteria bacterium]
MRGLGRLAGSLALTFVGLLAVTFVIGRVVPIDPVLSVVGDNAPMAVYQQAKADMGLDRPLHEQFLRFVRKAVTGDFGVSVLTAKPVVEDIKRVFPATIELATLATLLGVAVGVPLGVLAAVRRGEWPDQLARFLALLGYSVPVFWLGLMGLLVFYARLDLVGGPGR